MKTLLLSLVANLAVSALGLGTLAMAEDAKALFQYNNAGMIGGSSFRMQIRDNGDIHAFRGRAPYPGSKPAFDKVVDRLDARAMENVKAALSLLKPGMKLRELTAREKRLLKGCAMDSAISYIALGAQYEYGRHVVWQAQGCGINTGLANKRAERAMSALRAILDKALADHQDEIYK